MEIKILGTGCTKCKTLERKVKELVAENQIDAKVVYVNDLNEMINAGIMMTPGLIINDEVKSIGIVPRNDQMLTWINEAQK